jgi:hypothetical protein
MTHHRLRNFGERNEYQWTEQRVVEIDVCDHVDFCDVGTSVLTKKMRIKTEIIGRKWEVKMLSQDRKCMRCTVGSGGGVVERKRLKNILVQSNLQARWGTAHI